MGCKTSLPEQESKHNIIHLKKDIRDQIEQKSKRQVTVVNISELSFISHLYNSVRERSSSSYGIDKEYFLKFIDLPVRVRNNRGFGASECSKLSKSQTGTM